MRFNLTVTPIDGDPYETVASFPEIVKAEAHFDGPISEILDRYTTTLFLAWAAATRHGDTSLGFDDWLATIEACQLTIGESPGPTDPSQPSSS